MVGCGSCPACQELKRNSLSNRLALEEHRSKYCSFVTLTYDEAHLPIVDVSRLFSGFDGEVVDTFNNDAVIQFNGIFQQKDNRFWFTMV